MAAVVDAQALLASAAAPGTDGAPIAYKHDDLAYDLGLMVAIDSHPLDPVSYKADKESALAQAATGATQLLVRRIWELPIEKTDLGPVAMLPTRTTRLPRALPPPAPRAMTRWEKFAKEKGIEKEKRSRLVFDEATGDWKPRWGKDRAKDGTHDWLIPVKQAPGKGKPGGKGSAPDPMDIGEDEFSKRDLAKKDRVNKNSLSQLKNIQRATKRGGETGEAAAQKLLGSMGTAASSGPAGKKAAGKKRGREERGEGEAPATKKVFKFDGIGAPASSSNGGAAALVAPRVQAVDVPVRAPKGGAHASAAADGKAKLKMLKGKKGPKPIAVSATDASHPAGLPSILAGEGRVDLPGMGAGKSAGRKAFVKEPKEVKTAKLKLAQGSTASMGRVSGVARRKRLRSGVCRLARRSAASHPISTPDPIISSAATILTPDPTFPAHSLSSLPPAVRQDAQGRAHAPQGPPHHQAAAHHPAVCGGALAQFLHPEERAGRGHGRGRARGGGRREGGPGRARGAGGRPRRGRQPRPERRFQGQVRGRLQGQVCGRFQGQGWRRRPQGQVRGRRWRWFQGQVRPQGEKRGRRLQGGQGAQVKALARCRLHG